MPARFAGAPAHQGADDRSTRRAGRSSGARPLGGGARCLVTGRYPSTAGKATTIAITTVSGQAKLLVGGFDGSGTGSRFFAARFQLGCVNIRACTVGVQTSGNSATFTQTNTTAQSNGILVERVLRYKRIAGRQVPVTRTVRLSGGGSPTSPWSAVRAGI